MKVIQLESLDLSKCLKAVTDLFVQESLIRHYLEPPILEDEDGGQWLFYKVFAEPSGIRTWENYAHYKLHYLPPEKIAFFLISQYYYEREYAKNIINNKRLDSY